MHLAAALAEGVDVDGVVSSSSSSRNGLASKLGADYNAAKAPTAPPADVYPLSSRASCSLSGGRYDLPCTDAAASATDRVHCRVH